MCGMESNKANALMVRAIRVAVLLIFLAAQLQETSAQSHGESSTYGKEFVLGFLPNINGHESAQLQLIIGSPAKNVPFMVETIDSVIFQGNVSSNSPVSIALSSELDVTGTGPAHREKGIRVTSGNDDPIFVLGANFLEGFNYGIFLAYPCPAEPVNQDEVYEYRILSVGTETIHSLFMLVGCHNDTRVTVSITQTINLPVDFQDPNSAYMELQEGDQYNLTLHHWNTLLFFAFQEDLSGTKIISNKPLTVIGGNDCAYVPQLSFDCEPMSVQIPPVTTWGTDFIVAGYAGRMSDQLHFSVVPVEEGTTLVATCGNSWYSYSQISYQLALYTDDLYCYFNFSKPVFLSQLAYGESIDGLGDPAISIVSPVNQYINTIEFVFLPMNDFPSNYVSITVPAEHYDPDSIVLDGTVVDCEWVAINNRLISSDIVGYGCNVTMTTRNSTMPTQHRLSHTEPAGRISATVYGFRASPAQGYAYLSGQVLTEDSSQDNNECTIGTHECVTAAICMNTAESFTCLCPSGFSGDGMTVGSGGNGCTDDDECTLGTHTCVAEATCMNNPGSFTCACPTGFSGDGMTAASGGNGCTDDDECTLGTHTCVAEATCMNNPGSFTCGCPSGFSGDGMTAASGGNGCTDDNECTDGTHDCVATATCMNTMGNFTCTCPTGFSGDGRLSGTGCIDEENLDTLEFIEISNFGNVRQLPRRRDSFSNTILIPRPGMLYGKERLTRAFVNENGVISLGGPWLFSHPTRFPTNNFNIRSRGRALAPFWSDIDIRKSGNVWYATASENDPQNQIEYQELDRVNAYVNSVLSIEKGDNNTQFRGAWMLVAHWDHVHPSPHGANNHQGIPEEELEKTNNFQAVLVTNFSHTFAIYNYICGEMEWSGFGDEKATVGFIASREIFNNHPASGFALIGDAVSCPITGKTRRKRRELEETNGNSILQGVGIGDGDDNLQDRIRFCVRGTSGDAILNVAGINIASLLEPCPPRQSLAEIDVGRFIRFGTDDNPQCFITAKPLRITQPAALSQFTFTQQCCYSAGVLEYDPIPQAGGLLHYHPIIDEDNYLKEEQTFRKTCCTAADPDFCSRYFARRPTNDGSGYKRPLLAVGVGDPHYQTFDRHPTYYHFQGRGTYSTLDVLNENGDTIFSLQGRQGTGQCPPRGVTWHTGIAFGEPNVLSYQFGESPGFRVFRTAPDKLEISNQLQIGVPYYDSEMRSMLLKVNSVRLIAAFFGSGVVVRADNYYPSCRDIYMKVEALVPRTHDGRTRGLFGLMDGDPSNDLMLRNGTILPPNSGRGFLYSLYDNSWRIDPADSMFFVQEADRKKRQEPDDFTPVFFDQLSFSEEQISFCEGNEQCLFDLVVTEDTEFAERTLIEQREANDTIEQLENFAPNISGNGTFQVNLREESTYIIQVEDSNDNYTINIHEVLPPNSVLEELGDGEYLFRWTLQELTNDPLVFVATDTRNASSTHTPIVEVCACANDGVCTIDGLLTNNLTITMACVCSEAFSGQFCEEDRNGCSELECFEGVECLDVPAPGTGAVCGACPLGFTGDGLKCYDINECALNENECEQLCINTEGSFQCDCISGYQLLGTTQCEDVDECTDNLHDCEQVCENTVGSYNCSCEPGFTLAFDDRNCTANQPCDDGGGCSHVCAVISGAVQCFCPFGLQLSLPGGTQCVDINECLKNSTCDQICVNTFGSFECMCSDGYSLQTDGRNCEDVDECFQAALGAVDLCENDQNTQCVNTEGSFECVCVPGFERENGTCQVIEEEPPPPPPVATPPNGLESSVSFLSPTLNISDFTPERQQQFREVTANAVVRLCMNTTCSVVTTDRNMEERYNLQPRPRNVAIPAGITSQLDSGELNITFYVQFDDGSILHSENLTTAVEDDVEEYRHARFLPDIDECSMNNGGCEQVCMNNVGSFYCDCYGGFTLNANGTTCDDDNECTDGTHDCVDTATCMNTMGSFACACPSGFSGDGMTAASGGIECTDDDECTLGTHTCVAEATCMNNPGSFTCACPSGFSGDGMTAASGGNGCTDDDECTLGTHTCVAEATCMNNPGSFTCACPSGFSGDGMTVASGGIECTDDDECTMGTHTCVAEATCMNNPGSFTCACPSGFSGDGMTAASGGNGCTDDDECTLGTHTCVAEATCMNNPGSFTCACPSGFSGDGMTVASGGIECTDDDECTLGTHTCVAEATCMNNPGSFTCACPSGFSGDGMTAASGGNGCTDDDECTLGTHTCVAEATCMNNPESFTCGCPSGFSGDGMTAASSGNGCTDDDECTLGTHTCVAEATCMNNPGSFTCACPSGFSGDGMTAASSGNGCTDDDECTLGTHTCVAEATCMNNPGSFTCACPSGFSGDGMTAASGGIECTDDDECTLGTHTCVAEATCMNNPGSFTCGCPSGFSGDGMTAASGGNGCTDDDECTLGTHTCVAEATCMNNPGSFTCACPSGFSGDGMTVASGGIECTDDDECTLGTHTCVAEATCMNNPGSFTCACPSGFSGDGMTVASGGIECTDDDECTLGTHTCVAEATCMNNPGSFSCACPSGFSGDGMTAASGGIECTDDDECTLGTHTCVVEATCMNNPGSFTCACPSGFSGDGMTVASGGIECTDDDECTLGTHTCVAEATCMNNPESFTCGCPSGFSGDGMTAASGGNGCTDDDECTLGTHTCVAEATCMNNPGSFTCACPSGFSGDGMTAASGGNGCTDDDECTLGTHTCVAEATCMNNPESFTCGCPSGFSGDGMTAASGGNGCTDDDECTLGTHTCVAEATCMNNPGSFTCACPSGFSGDGMTAASGGNGCTDDDECTLGTHTCVAEATCMNNPGSFTCGCSSGFSGDGMTAASGGIGCTDDDECTLGTHTCVAEATCMNNPGSFTCGCPSGFSGDGMTAASGGNRCTDDDECTLGTHTCVAEATCMNNPGSFTCACPSGFSGDGMTAASGGNRCTDDDECTLGTHTCVAEATCMNNPGSFTCACPSGFSGDGMTAASGGNRCTDDDECTLGTHTCVAEATCMNNPGSFTCACPSGFSGDGMTAASGGNGCTDDNECTDGTHDCVATATCMNTMGSFTCACPTGFSGDGRSRAGAIGCTDIDECSTNNGGCEHICTNTAGSFNCSCNSGFSLNTDRTTCDDIDECSSNNGNCDHMCNNSFGSFNCSCENGFILNANRFACDDINECSVDKGGCDQICTNIDGSFICSCYEGFVLSSDGNTCDEMELLPKIEEQAGLLVSVDGYSIQTFTVEVQRDFKLTTAMALNMYCVSNPLECKTLPVPLRKRQSDLFTEEDIVIANIVDNDDNDGNGVQFELYVLLEEDLSILSRDIVQLAVQDNVEVYQSAGFTSVSTTFLVAKGLSTAEIVGIVIGCLLIVLLLILVVVIGLSYMVCFRRTKNLDVKNFHGELEFVNPNFKEENAVKEEDTSSSVQCVHITFKDDPSKDGSSHPLADLEQPDSDHEKEEISAL